MPDDDPVQSSDSIGIEVVCPDGSRVTVPVGATVGACREMAAQHCCWTPDRVQLRSLGGQVLCDDAAEICQCITIRAAKAPWNVSVVVQTIEGATGITFEELLPAGRCRLAALLEMVQRRVGLPMSCLRVVCLDGHGESTSGQHVLAESDELEVLGVHAVACYLIPEAFRILVELFSRDTLWHESKLHPRTALPLSKLSASEKSLSVDDAKALLHSEFGTKDEALVFKPASTELL